MTWPTFAPVFILTLLSLLLGWKPLPLHPSWSARILVISGVSTALAVLSTILFISAVFVAGFLSTGAVLSWGSAGRFLIDHGPV
ncbi:hypothetical protein [Nocardiopsis nanhaiensis]